MRWVFVAVIFCFPFSAWALSHADICAATLELQAVASLRTGKALPPTMRRKIAAHYRRHRANPTFLPHLFANVLDSQVAALPGSMAVDLRQEPTERYDTANTFQGFYGKRTILRLPREMRGTELEFLLELHEREHGVVHRLAPIYRERIVPFREDNLLVQLAPWQVQALADLIVLEEEITMSAEWEWWSAVPAWRREELRAMFEQQWMQIHTGGATVQRRLTEHAPSRDAYIEREHRAGRYEKNRLRESMQDERDFLRGSRG